MILKQIGQTFVSSDERGIFYIGQEVVANHQSDYAGLPGVITEIRDGEDRETDNPEADIYCTFKIPVPENPYFTETLEQRFGCNHKDITLDSVVMSSHMLEPKMSYQMNTRASEMLVLSYYVDTDSEHDDYILCVSDDRVLLEKRLNTHKDANNNIPADADEDIDRSGSAHRYIYTSDDKYFCYSIFPVETEFKMN